jgi:hypothetical protein
MLQVYGESEWNPWRAGYWSESVGKKYLEQIVCGRDPAGQLEICYR